MMLTDQLQRILAVEEQERRFYVQQLKPALNRLEHAEDLHDERSTIEKLVTGTAFERAFHALDASGTQTQDTLEHLYKLNHVCHDLMHANHMARQSEVEILLKNTAQPELTPIALYYLGCLYSQGDNERDSERAHAYLEQALSCAQSTAQVELAEKIRELYAQNYDRWQLRKAPPEPQRYGTIYADHYDVAKGLEKNHLIPPYVGYHYQIEDLNRARKELGLGAWSE
jgi:hypothetical protein